MSDVHILVFPDRAGSGHRAAPRSGHRPRRRQWEPGLTDDAPTSGPQARPSLRTTSSPPIRRIASASPTTTSLSVARDRPT
ncbi:hypothetical protein [Ornithinimicrobium kibberense]|uniref:hypothetical protein n=1 Tax=Ornithinimicrobium kibberense TaxID=282060 RepID=UPI003614FF3E